eukprot:SAG11_NODE_4291_length_1967_cov_1.268201_2_plen_104_part_00
MLDGMGHAGFELQIRRQHSEVDAIRESFAVCKSAIEEQINKRQEHAAVLRGQLDQFTTETDVSQASSIVNRIEADVEKVVLTTETCNHLLVGVTTNSVQKLMG